jgi:putative sterol carrier protein
VEHEVSSIDAVSSTGEATAAFFRELAARGHEPALEQAVGTIRFELTGGGRPTRWLLAIDDGDVSVSRRSARGDCVVRADGALFDGIASGEVNAMAALLRGAIEVKGDRALLLAFQRVLPGPPRKT